MVGNKGRIGEENGLFSAINGLDIHIADRKGQSQGVIGLYSDERVEYSSVAVCNLLSWRRESVPVLDEGVGKIGSGWTSKTKMCIERSMLKGGSWMKSSAESVDAVYHQEFATIRGVTTGIQYMPGSTEGMVLEPFHSSSA
jgi:hypothetical protein